MRRVVRRVLDVRVLVRRLAPGHALFIPRRRRRRARGLRAGAILVSRGRPARAPARPPTLARRRAVAGPFRL